MSSDKLAALDPEPEIEQTPAPIVKSDETPADSEPTECEAKKPEEPAKEPTKESVTTAVDEDAPPPVPTRPKAKQLTQTEITISELVDMFPTLDPKYIKMALIASEGRLEPASNALLFLSDPDSGIEIPTFKTPVAESIEESDEALARRLAKAYERGSKRASGTTPAVPPRPQHRRSPSMGEHTQFNNYDQDNEDDIYDTLTKNVNDAKQVVGSWFGNVAKKIQDTVDSYEYPAQPQQQKQNQTRYNPNTYNHYESKPLPKRNPYQQPQSIQRGYYTQENEYVTADNDDDDAPKLPTRKSNARPQQQQASQSPQKFSAVGGSSASDVEIPGKITMNDTETEPETKAEAEIIPSKDAAPAPVDKDGLYSSATAQITMNKKSTPTTATTATTTTGSKPSSPTKNWTPLKSIDPEPSNDAFLVDDSEDEEK